MSEPTGFMIAVQILYRDGTRRSCRITLPGIDERVVAKTAAALIRRAASRPVEDVMAIPLGPAPPGPPPRWLREFPFKTGSAIDFAALGLELGI